MTTLRTQAVVSAKDEASATLKKIAGEFDKLDKTLARTKELDGASKRLDTLAKVDTRGIAAVGNAISESTRREIAAMQLKEAELRKLTKTYSQMEAERDRAMAGVGNPRIREQLRLKDEALVHQKIISQARAAHAERQMLDELSGRRERDAARASAKDKLAVERQAAADRLRAARDEARSARRQESDGAREAAREQVRTAREGARVVREATRHEERVAHRAKHYGRGAATMALGSVGAGYGAERLAHYAIDKSADMEQERARGYLLGYTPEEQAHSDALSLDLQKRYPSIGRVAISEHLRSLTGTFADMHHAEQTLPDVVRANVVLGSLRGNDAAAGDLDQLVKGIEALGAANDPVRFRRLLDSFLKGASYFGAGVTGSGFREYIQNAKTSALGVNDDFLTTVAPTMMQHDGAGKFGTMQRMAFSALVGGRQTKAAKAIQQGWGILDKDGHPLHEREMIQNPFDFAVKYLEPGLAKKGLKFDDEHKDKLIAELTRGFSNSNAGEFFASLLLNKEIINKARPGLTRAKGTEAAQELPGRSPQTALAGLSEGIATFAQVLLQPYVQKAPSVLRGLTSAIATATSAVEAHPGVRSIAEKAFLGALPPALWGAGKVATAVAGEGTGILSNALRFGGKAATRLGRFGTRLLPGVGEAVLAKDAYDVITTGGTEFGRIATGAYWQPKSRDELIDLKEQRSAIQEQISGASKRRHPGLSIDYDPNMDRMLREEQELTNRINSFNDLEAARNTAMGIRGSSEIGAVGTAGASFGLHGAVASSGGGFPGPTYGAAPPPLPPARPPELTPVAKVETPIPVAVTFSAIEVRANVKVEGPGVVTFTGVTPPVARSTGTTMAPAVAGGT